VGLDIANCQFPIANFRLGNRSIHNRPIINRKTHPLPRGGTDLMARWHGCPARHGATSEDGLSRVMAVLSSPLSRRIC